MKDYQTKISSIVPSQEGISDGEWVVEATSLVGSNLVKKNIPLTGFQLDLVASVRVELARIFQQPISECFVLDSISSKVHLVQFRPEFYPDPVMPVVIGLQFIKQSKWQKLVKNYYRDWDKTYRAFVDVIFAYAQNYGHTNQDFTFRLRYYGQRLEKLLAKSNLNENEKGYVSKWLLYLSADPLCKFGGVRVMKKVTLPTPKGGGF